MKGFMVSDPWTCLSKCVLPVKSVRFRDGAVKSTGGSITDQLEQQDHTVAALLGDSQVHALPWLRGDLNYGIGYPAPRGKEDALDKSYISQIDLGYI